MQHRDARVDSDRVKSQGASKPRMIRDWKGNLVPAPDDSVAEALVSGKKDVPVAAPNSVPYGDMDEEKKERIERRGERLEAGPKAPGPPIADRWAVSKPVEESVRETSTEDDSKEVEKEKPPAKVNFGLSGVLAEDERTGNMFRGRKLKFTEPSEARVPSRKWRLHVFRKGEQMDQPIPLHRQSAYLFGKDDGIADIPTLHPSCSRQHAVIQFRLVQISKEGDSEIRRSVKPYILDLESTNGTFLNGTRIESGRYIELRAQDMLKFGESSREYILLHDELIGKS